MCLGFLKSLQFFSLGKSSELFNANLYRGQIELLYNTTVYNQFGTTLMAIKRSPILSVMKSWTSLQCLSHVRREVDSMKIIMTFRSSGPRSWNWIPLCDVMGMTCVWKFLKIHQIMGCIMINTSPQKDVAQLS